MHQTKSLVLAAAVVLLASTGCYTVHVNSGASPDGPNEPRIGWHVLYGLTRVDHGVPECPDGFANVTFRVPLWGICVTSLTVGILTPTEMRYQCVQRGGASVEQGDGLPEDLSAAEVAMVGARAAAIADGLGR